MLDPASRCAQLKEEVAGGSGTVSAPREQPNVHVAVKTTLQYHATRVPLLREKGFRGGVDFGKVMFFSETLDPGIPTIEVPFPNSGAQGHCAKTMFILQHMRDHAAHVEWLLVADDDTALNGNALRMLVRDLQSSYGDVPLLVGERYRQGHMDFVTGGGGMLLNKAGLDAMTRCECPGLHVPDDMFLGHCAVTEKVTVYHHPGFHQAPPSSYSPVRLSTEFPLVSFHKTMDFEERDWAAWTAVLEDVRYASSVSPVETAGEDGAEAVGADKDNAKAAGVGKEDL
jgi:hypothetical protein